MSDDQEPAPLDLAAIEQELHDALDDRQYARWAKFRGWALVTALKARDERYQELLELARRESTWRDAIDEVLKLRADLARVEADNARLSEYLRTTEDAFLRRGNEIYGVGGLKETIEQLRDDLARVEADYQNASQWHREAMAANERLQVRIDELEGSLRPFSEAAIKIDSWGVVVDDDLDLILLDESEVGLTVAELRNARDVLAQTPAAS